MQRPRNFGYSEQYEAVRGNLERQTAALLAQRKQLQNAYPERQENGPWIRPAYHQSTAFTPVVHSHQQSQGKTQEVVNKLQEIIRLCKQEGELNNDEMRQVVKVQTEVLNFLQKTTGEQQGYLSQTASQALAAAPRTKSEVYQVNHHQYPQQVNAPQVPQAHQAPFVAQATHSSQAQQGSEANYPPQFQQSSQGQFTWGKQHHQSKPLSEDTLEIIGYIERRALGQIMNLQQERDHLKKQKQIYAAELERLKGEFTRLNYNQSQQQQRPQTPLEEQRFSRIDAGQIQRLREENRALKANLGELDKLRHENRLLKEDNQYLNVRVQALGNFGTQIREVQKPDNRSTYPEHPRTDLIYGQYDSQITVYENQLKRATVVINELRARLANVPGLQQLHDQGQRIRRQTTELLQLKASGGGTGFGQMGSYIRELQARLAEEERGKAAFLEELKVFKQKYLDLEEENRYLKKSKVNFDPVPRPQGSTPRRDGNYASRSIIKKKVGQFGDYEQTLNQLKNVLY